MRTRFLAVLLVVAACSGDDGVNHLADAPPLPDAPTDAPPTVELTTTIAGTGAGTVTSSPAGISCSNGTCTGGFDPNTLVTLTAVPDTGSVFVSWGGACSGTTPTCEVTLAQAASVTATFDLAKYAVTVTKAGAGMGTVAGNGLNCGATCTVMLDYGTMLSLTATPANLSVFAGWGGACTGTATCNVMVTGPTAISANFPLDTLTLFVTKGGNGAGTVTATGINCGADCDETYTAGQMVTLTAAASTGSTFTGWSGGGCSGTSTCTVTITAATTVTATFTLQQFALTVTKAGNGTGNVVSTPTGIACGTDCMENYDYNSMVTLTATPSMGSAFTGWSGACTGTAMCVVTVTQARAVTATFTLQQFALTTTVAGTGAGTVTSAPVGINCPTDCTENYNFGQMVTLTAAASTGSTFMGWSGACTGTGTCSVTMDAAKAVTATFTINQYTLTVAKAGTGGGTVTGTGIACGADCTETVNFGTMITLTAAANMGSTFVGWNGGGCTGTGMCTVTVAAATTVTATFDVQTFMFTTTIAGNGTGSVTSAPTGINCPGDCTEIYNYNQTVTLTATPGTGSTFTGWNGGGCSGTGTCVVSVTAVTSVTATFTLMQFAVNIAKAGAGTGTVTSAPAGINCGVDCTENYDYNTFVTLTAVASTPSSTFAGWSGGGCVGTGTCIVQVTMVANVTATFNLANYALTVSRNGTGSGSVTSMPAGINCPTVACMANFVYPTSVTLTATPDAVSDFAGWTGAGCSGTGTCVVAMTAARSVTATFNKKPRTLSIKFSGDGSGTVTANGMTCTATCNLTFPDGTVINMTATANSLNSNSSTFKGFTGNGAAAGCMASSTCSFTIGATATTVDSNFKLNPNIMFVTRGVFFGNLGVAPFTPPNTTPGLAEADAKCQAAASAVGLKGNYKAFISGAGPVHPNARFPGASGWVRTDGTVMVQAITAFGVTNVATPSFDENGVDISQLGTTGVWTAAAANGTSFGQNCNNTGSPGDWSTTSARTSAGLLNTTTGANAGAGVQPCLSQFHLYCFGTDRAATVP